MLTFKIKSFQAAFVLTFLLVSCTQSLPAKDKEEVKASAIIKMLDKEQVVELDNKTISGDLDFSQVEAKAKIHSTLYQSVVKSAVSFTNCQFTGKVICSSNSEGKAYQTVFTQNLIFNTCEFSKVADFQSVTVFGNVSFSGSQFKDLALFNSFYSHAKASFFGQIKAEKDFSMQDALFVGSCDFFKSQFKGNVSFQGSRFDGAFNFSTAVCDARADFSKVRLNNNSTFNYTVFNGVARFNQLRTLGTSDFIQVQFIKDAVFTNALFYDVCKFNEAKVAASFDFSGSVFYSGSPAMEKIELAYPSLYKVGSFIQSGTFALPQVGDK